MLSFAKSLVIFSFVVAFAVAQNVVTSITSSTNLTPGQPFTITWTPDSGSTVTLILRKGDANDLSTVGTIASNIPNTGTYTWYPENTLAGGTDYAIETVGANGNIDYSHFFGIDNGVVASSASSTVPVTTLPENLLTDSTMSDSFTASAIPVTIISGNSTSTSFSYSSIISGSSMSSMSGSANSASSTTMSTTATSSGSLHSAPPSSTATASSKSEASSLFSRVSGKAGFVITVSIAVAVGLFMM
jgi:hypothetical protein